MISAVKKTITPIRLQERLRELSGRNLLLMITDNTRTMLSQKKEGRVLVIRMHRMFLNSPEKVIHALVWWIKGKRNDYEHIRDFIESNDDKIRIVDPLERKVNLVTDGKCYDLAELFDNINKTYLQGRSKASITWGRKISKKRASLIRLGCYDPVRNMISISQRLDRRDIPRYMIEFVIFHEMLHEILGIGERPDGKRDIHGKTFRLMEQTYPYYEDALKFEKKKWGGGS